MSCGLRRNRRLIADTCSASLSGDADGDVGIAGGKGGNNGNGGGAEAAAMQQCFSRQPFVPKPHSGMSSHSGPRRQHAPLNPQ
jgi:hypothetical protein